MQPIQFVVLCLLYLLPALGSGQIDQAHVKETWEYMAEKKPYSSASVGLIDYALQVEPFSAFGYGEDLGFACEGYVVMYEVTKDKAYLIHALNRFLEAIAWRKENLRFNNSLYKDGVLLWAMAHWTKVVLSDEVIYNSILDMDLVVQTTSMNPSNILPYSVMHTYEDVARWLLAKLVETMDAVIADHWSNDRAFSARGGLNGLNQEIGFAAALLHLGHLSTLTSSFSGLASYLDKGARMAVLLKQSLHLNDRCNNRLFSGPILQEDAPSNSYWWYHAGWDVSITESCQSVMFPYLPYWDEPNAESYLKYLEDTSHGILSIQLPLIASSIPLFTGGGYPFSDAEMVKFRNMFTKKIYSPDVFGKFNNSVKGTTGPISYEEQQTTDWPGKDHFRSQMFGFARLFKYDEVSGAAEGPSVYSILVDEYIEQGQQLTGTFSGGIHVYGLAEFVAAQWERECFSLDLYNRELVYDQDFAAKNILRVFPAGEAGASFADPVIYEPRFTVNENIRSEFRAGSAVIFEPGFEAVRGSVVEAVIDPLGCDLAYKANLPFEYPRTEVRAPEARERTMTEQDAPVSVEQAMDRQMIDAFRLVPNPTSGETYAELQLGVRRLASLTIHDALGRQVWSGQFGTLVAGEHRHPVGIRLPVGVYHCTLTLDGVPHTQRLVVE